MIIMPNPIVMLKIKRLYPYKITRVAIKDEDTNKWSCALIEVLNDGSLGDVIYSMESYEFDTDQMALSQMSIVIDLVMEGVRVMSN